MNEQPQSKVKDTWEAGEAYGFFMGRWSHLVAVEFLRWLSVAPKKEWLDVGCGTGMLSRTILDVADPLTVKGIDQAAGFISFAGNSIRDARARFEIGLAESIKSEPNTYDAVVSGLALNFVERDDLAVSEMKRVAKKGGVIAAYVWDYAVKMQFLRHFWNVAMSLDSRAAEYDEGKRFPLCNPESLRDLFVEQGLGNVVVRPIEVQTHFTNFEDYWSPFLAGQGPAPSYVASLGMEQQLALKERVRVELPVATDGTIDLIARAWAVRGIHE